MDKTEKLIYTHRGTVVTRVASVMRWRLRKKKINGLSHKPHKVVIRYVKEFGVDIDLSTKTKVQDYCISLFLDPSSLLFYHCGNRTNLPKILKSLSEPIHEIKQGIKKEPPVPKKTWRDMPDKIGNKNNYAKYRAYINSNAWASFRKEAFKHHGKMCNRCHRDELPVEVHHLTYERLFKELLMDVEILCKYCHQKEHTHRRKK